MDCGEVVANKVPSLPQMAARYQLNRNGKKRLLLIDSTAQAWRGGGKEGPPRPPAASPTSTAVESEIPVALPWVVGWVQPQHRLVVIAERM